VQAFEEEGFGGNVVRRAARREVGRQRWRETGFEQFRGRLVPFFEEALTPGRAEAQVMLHRHLAR
jgi:hypothetical protein